MTSFELLEVFVVAVLGAGLVYAVSLFGARRVLPAIHQAEQRIFSETFLFDGPFLIDATHHAKLLLNSAPPDMSEFDAVLYILADRFPALKEAVGHIRPNERCRVMPNDGSAAWIEVSQKGQIRCIKLIDERPDATENVAETLAHDTMMTELTMLRDMMEHSPQLIWQLDRNDKLIWANHAYLNFAETHTNSVNPVKVWPNGTLFPDLDTEGGSTRPVMRRISVIGEDKKNEHWFDVTSIQHNLGSMHFAVDANAVVRAEQAQRNFVQTLSKTFAGLAIGLAIFDRNRQLAMFNPAILELTGLKAGFLSARPSVEMFLDQLREFRMLPEPRDYATWRERFSAVETAAKNGTYSENWDLPNGQTFRVTGRPHPDGAFAFLFEDISAEVTLARRFRAEVETGQTVLDTITDAIAVFSGAGTLVMTNKAYSDLWDIQADEVLQAHDFRAELRVWQDQCTASPAWGELRKYVAQGGERKPWSKSVTFVDGQQLVCAAQPVAGGMTLIKFTHSQRTNPRIQKLLLHDPALMSAKV